LKINFNTIFGATSGILLCTVALFTSCQNSSEEIKAISLLDSIVSTEYAEGVKLSYTDSGKLKAVIYAPKTVMVHSNEDPYTEMPDGVKAEFYDLNHKIESTIKAKYAISYQNRKIIEARNSVEVVNIKDEKLETEQLIWDQQKQQIYTDKYVKITTRNQIITGKGMRANENFTKWTIFKPSGEFTVEDDKQMDSSSAMDGTGSNLPN
jgi:LPS export ABC transporter protein LptC